MRNQLVHRILGVSILTATISLASGAAATELDHRGDYLNVPSVQWAPCFQDFGTFECANYEVPLDHSTASKFFYVNGGQEGINIAVIRIPATDPANKIGSLFLNPGGPGGSGVGFVINAGAFLYTDEVRAKFDIVGFDPRGINFSSALSCFTSFEHLDELNALPPYPQTIEEAQAQLKFDDKFQQHCATNAGSILDNMTTADVARDMDILRQAVGDKQLSYAGYSYGSFLGVTYANLFPKRVRALIVDAVLDPIQWTTGDSQTGHLPVTTRLRSDAGAQATLDEFLRLCDLAGTARCALSGNASARYDNLIAKYKANPITLVFDDGSELFVDNVVLVAATLSTLYNTGSWFFLANDLAFLETLLASTASATDFNVLGRAANLDNTALVQQTIEGFPGVLCSESDSPTNPIAWPLAASAAERDYGYFGPAWTWSSSPCSNWPASKSSRYAGPFTRYTANPVLVTSTLYDPATRYEGAVTVSNLLPNSHLLTVEGWGHATLFVSQCATEIGASYLVDGTLPPAGTTCQQDFPPFFLAPGEVFSTVSAAETTTQTREVAEANRTRVIDALRGNRPTYGDK